MNTYQKEKINNANVKNLFILLSNHKLSYIFYFIFKKIILKISLKFILNWLSV